MRRIKLFRSQDRGATAVEYALMVAILGAAVAVAVPLMTGPLGSLFEGAVDAFALGIQPDE